jgi:hypothetical protein
MHSIAKSESMPSSVHCRWNLGTDHQPRTRRPCSAANQQSSLKHDPRRCGRSIPGSAISPLASLAVDIWQKILPILRILLISSSVFIALSFHADAELLSDKEVGSSLKQHGVAVYIADFVSGGCWIQSESAKNHTIEILGSRNLLNKNSPIALAISAVGYRYQGICVVMLDIHVTSAHENSTLLHTSLRRLFSGPETSDNITSIVRDFIEKLVAALEG